MLSSCTIAAYIALSGNTSLAAQAADGVAQPAPAVASVVDPGDITVTARRRTETLLDVPLAITALSAQQLANSGVKDLRDIAQLTPGLIVTDGGAQFYATPTIRGLSQLNTQNGAIENNVSVFLNGIYLQNAGAVNLSLLNLERVEVVKGPVSALYGRSAFAGAINYVTKRPTQSLSATADGTVGSYDRYAISASVSGPITTGIRATIGGVYDSFGGTWHDPVNGNDAGGYKKKDVFATIEADLAPATLLTINGYYGKDHFDQPAQFHLTNNCAVNGFGVAQAYCGRIPEGKIVEVPDTYNSGSAGNARSVKHVDAKLATELGGGFSADLLAGWNQEHARQFLEINNRRDGLTYNLVPGPGTIALNEYYGDDNSSKDYSFEGRISSPKYDHFRFSVGGFYYHSSGQQISNISLNSDLLPAGQLTDSFLANLWLTPGAVPSMIRNRAKTTGDQYSGFAEGEYKITDSINIAQEIRYTSEDKGIHVLSSAVAPGATFAPLSANYHYWNTRSTLRYMPSREFMAYISAANGTKSGGFNGRATFAADESYNPEKNWTYELGVKGTLFDRMFSYEAAVYHIDWSSLQILGPNSDPNNPGQLVKNYGGAKNTGFEIQTATRIARGVTFNLGFAYNDPKFSKGSIDAQFAGICAALPSCRPNLITSNGQSVIDIQGNALPRQSKFQITSSLDATVPINDRWDAFAYLKGSFQSKQYFETANLSTWGPNYNIGARLGIKNKNVSASIWVENLLNQTDAYSALYNIRITDFVFETLPLYNDKRTVGLTVSLKY